MTDSWWPLGYRDPAFVVQRQVYGFENGGDYVRGTSVMTLPHTALRYASTTPGFTDATKKAYLTIRWWGHEVVRTEMTPGVFQVKETGVSEINWGWPNEIDPSWSEVALVRSGFGFPLTPADGQTVFRALHSDFTNLNDDDDVPPVVYDRPLQPGQFYYYTLFFKTTPFDWITGMQALVLIPHKYGFDQHMWDAIPPYYQRVDSNLREGEGPLRQMLRVFGAELDSTREYVEQWQETYHIDKCPLPLLKQVGANFGVPYKAGVGDIRYRAMLAGLPEMLAMRGTITAMRQVVTTGTKYGVDITLGENIMLLTDDSIFTAGTGNWGSMHPGTGVAGWTAISSDKVTLTNTGNNPPSPMGLNSMRIVTDDSVETTNLSITCGCTNGTKGNVGEVYPLTAGIPVRPGSQYAFSFKMYQELGLSTTVALLWFNAGGKPSDLISTSQATAFVGTAGAWQTFLFQAVAPPTSVYVTPALYFTSRVTSPVVGRSGFIDIAGVMVYVVDDVSAPKQYIAPDKYLTLGAAAEFIGPVITGQEATTGFILGDPYYVP